MYDYSITVNERTGGCQYKVRLLDAAGVAIAPARVTSLQLSLRDVKSNSFLNDRDHQDVLNDNNVALLDTGWLTWTMVPDDNALVSLTRSAEEVHEATFTVKADAGAVELSWSVEIRVRPLKAVP